MTDWSDEVEARLEADADGRGAEGCYLLMRQRNDIRAALGEIERRGVDADHEQGLRWLAEMKASELSALLTCCRIEWKRDRERAEAAEAREVVALADCARAEEYAARLKAERDEAVIHLGQYGRDVVKENAALRAEVLYEQERNRNNVAQYAAEVARLEGVVCRCELDELLTEGKRIRTALRGGGESPQPEPEQPATSKHNPAWRALGVGQPPSEEHSKHPTGDYCVYCRSQWPCEESGGE